MSAELQPPCFAHLLVFAIRLLGNVFGFFELELLDLHLLLVFHRSVLNHLHASVEQKVGEMITCNKTTNINLWTTLCKGANNELKKKE